MKDDGNLRFRARLIPLTRFLELMLTPFHGSCCTNCHGNALLLIEFIMRAHCPLSWAHCVHNEVSQNRQQRLIRHQFWRRTGHGLSAPPEGRHGSDGHHVFKNNVVIADSQGHFVSPRKKLIFQFQIYCLENVVAKYSYFSFHVMKIFSCVDGSTLL